jgi:Xaa-Pro aminopeptidase
VESYLLMRRYEGLMKSGRVQGRTSSRDSSSLREMAGSDKKDKMIFIRSDEEIALIKISAQVLGKAHAEVAKLIRPGITTKELDIGLQKRL